jgi:hypothetical protein
MSYLILTPLRRKKSLSSIVRDRKIHLLKKILTDANKGGLLSSGYIKKLKKDKLFEKEEKLEEKLDGKEYYTIEYSESNKLESKKKKFYKGVLNYHIYEKESQINLIVGLKSSDYTKYVRRIEGRPFRIEDNTRIYYKQLVRPVTQLRMTLWFEGLSVFFDLEYPQIVSCFSLILETNFMVFPDLIISENLIISSSTSLQSTPLLLHGLTSSEYNDLITRLNQKIELCLFCIALRSRRDIIIGKLPNYLISDLLYRKELRMKIAQKLILLVTDIKEIEGLKELLDQSIISGTSNFKEPQLTNRLSSFLQKKQKLILFFTKRVEKNNSYAAEQEFKYVVDLNFNVEENELKEEVKEIRIIEPEELIILVSTIIRNTINKANMDVEENSVEIEYLIDIDEKQSLNQKIIQIRDELKDSDSILEVLFKPVTIKEYLE